ncbi:MAG: methyltransferase domain-containing protein [Candidatus Diapherotrites archaeon]|nr:methyltransferase domain-containing protein [Candidatus Diapherotrites archaeon]
MGNLVEHWQGDVTGITKFDRIKEHFSKVCNERITILDCGGTEFSANFIQNIFPNAKITILNNNKQDLGKNKKYEQLLCNCYEMSKLHKKFDLIFANDLIEHLDNPDKFFEKARKICKAELIITTPNLSVWYNRVFLLFGFDLANYNSSKTRLGNPFLSEIGAAGHKSVFTRGSLKRILERYAFYPDKMGSFSYEDSKSQTAGRGGSIRKIINSILPQTWREGIIAYAKIK